MNFDEALNAVNTKDSVCKIGKWLESIADADRDAILKAFSTTPSYRIFRACIAMGLDSRTDSTWYSHWDGRCKCQKN